MNEFIGIPFAGWINIGDTEVTTFTTEDRIEATKFLVDLAQALQPKKPDEVEVPLINQEGENDEQQ